MTFEYKKQKSKLVFLLLAVLVLCTFGGCATRFPPAPVNAATGTYKYVLGPGDVLNVVVWRNPELTATVPIRPDGYLSTPLAEDVLAMGKDPVTLARDIEKQLSKVIRDPVVTVVVSSFVGPYSEQVRVIGEATRPQAIPYKQKMTMLDVMIAVGGLTDFADGNAASILRTSDGNKRYGIRLRDLVKRGDISANVEVLPGDVVIIPQSWF